MRNQRLAVNCLVQVNSDNRLDFEEWLNYHIALGFDTIFVCDNGNHSWLDEVCEKRREHVTLAPRDERWAFKSEIIQDYVSRREFEEWCICMDEHDFLWISPARAKSITEYADTIPGTVAAVTFYVKHMSSKEPTRYRVGTQMDCFTHTRREPEGFLPMYKALPNTGITMFRVSSQNMPLRDPVTPVYINNWVDSEFRQMTPDRFKSETTSRRFYPTAYSVRCYRYAIRSGVEMGFDDKMVPVGFDVQDLNMQKAREMYMHIPVNPETEALFAKAEPPETVQEPGSPKSVSVVAAESGLPITRARIDKLIFKGQFLEDIMKYVEEKDPNYDRALLESMFEEERKNIVATSSLYTEMQEMLDQGKDDAEIRRTLVLTETTYNRMKAALPVLDIKTKYADMVEESAGGDTSIQVKVGTAVPVQEHGDSEMESLVDAFEADQEVNAPTAEELATREEAVAMLAVKAKPKGKGRTSKKETPKKGTAKKKVKAAVVAGTAKKVGGATGKAETPEIPKDAATEELESLGDDLTGDIDLDSIVADRQTVPQDE